MKQTTPLGPDQFLLIGRAMMVLSAIGMAMAIYVAYGVETLTITQQIAGHLAIPVFAALFKVSYVVRLAAHHSMGNLAAG
ncbi:MAG: hypothetical protein WC023_01815 [Rhodocyclaceae bacterium]